MFQVFMERFDRIEATHKEYLKEMASHVKADNEVHAVVERHSTYWKLILLGLPVAGSAIAAKMGWK